MICFKSIRQNEPLAMPELAGFTMNFSEPELTSTACPACGYPGVFAALAPPADIAAVRKPHNKAGFSLNLEQQITDDLGAFARAGWSQGQYEAFEFTDINKTVSLGLSLAGKRWGRGDDTVGLAFAINDASAAAKRFFAAGGLGILVGDGTLVHSSPENIIETYYNWAAIGALKLTADYQFIVNPAYNTDRGPVSVFGIRAHIEF
jgi:high affinity Mn2+ porin